MTAAVGKLEVKTIHTGQHFDHDMSTDFLEEFHVAPADYTLDMVQDNRSLRMETMTKGIRAILQEEKPDYVVVYGDTDSTLAGAQAAAQCYVTVAHVEAGLRSFNDDMPEEYNRKETDKLSDLLFCPNESAAAQLNKEGISQGVHVVGDIMKDLLLRFVEHNSSSDSSSAYIYVSLHRPYNVDEPQRLEAILNTLDQLSYPIIFPLHPRTKARMNELKLTAKFSNITFRSPLAYTDNLLLIRGARAIITDSGGLQKEAYWLKKQCITLRPETEWMETLVDGANVLVFDDLSRLEVELSKQPLYFDEGLYGDGRAGERMVAVLNDELRGTIYEGRNTIYGEEWRITRDDIRFTGKNGDLRGTI